MSQRTVPSNFEKKKNSSDSKSDPHVNPRLHSFESSSATKFLNTVWNEVLEQIKAEEKKPEQRIQIYKTSEKAWGSSNSKPLITSSNDFLVLLQAAVEKQIN